MIELVSVIVPVYNAEAYLKRCIESILSQTYQELDIILVEDGSTDRSSKICEEYAQLDRRIRVIHKMNSGSTGSRKKGLEEAKGSYIAFVDSDDWLEPIFIESLMKEMLKNEVDIIASGCIKEYSDHSEVCYNHIPEGVYRGDKLKQEIYPQMLYHEGTFYTFGIQQYLWNKIYRKEILYPCLMALDDNIYNGEDVACLYDCILHSKSIQLINVCYYHYRLHSSSITAKEDGNIFLNIAYLRCYMEQCFTQTESAEVMQQQLKMYLYYMKSLANKRLYERNIIAFRDNSRPYLFPFELIEKGSSVILYAAGVVGKAFYHQLVPSTYCKLVLWVDKEYERYKDSQYPVKAPDEILKLNYDYIIICVEQEVISSEIEKQLLSMGVNKQYIIWSEKYLI